MASSQKIKIKIMDLKMVQKQKIIKEVLQKEELDALLFFSPENRF